MQRSRRASLRGCLTGVIAALALFTWTHSAWATPPNILIIVSDDHRSQGTMETPAMEKTRGWFQTGDLPGNETVPGGTAFPNGVATTPVCCPARASIFSGRYAHNHGVRTNSDAVQLNTNTTLQYYLKQQGYRTGLFGKYLNAWATVPPHWDEYSMYEGQYFPIRALEGVAGQPTPTSKTILEYTTNYIGDRALQFINQTPSGTPWLMYLAPATPHFPTTPEPQYANVDVGPLQETEAYLEEDRRDKPDWTHDRYGDDVEIKSHREAQLRSLYSLDNMVDRVMRAIQGTNTLAFFVGDNGYHWGEHGMQGKGSAYKESVRVPFYMRWPGSDPLNVPQDLANPALAANIDIAPTVLHAVGGPAPSVPMDGRSLIGPVPQQRSHQFLESGSQQEARPWESIRTSTFNYIETGDVQDWREYYDLTEDPHEVNNLLRDDDEENDPPVTTLEALVAAEKVCGQAGHAACPPALSDPATIPPDTAITANPDARTDSTSARFVFTSSIPDSSFECALDTTTFSACPAPSVKPWPYTHKFTGLAPGHHKLMVRAKSPSGVVDSSHMEYEWDIDATPDVVIESRPPKLTNSTTATFTFSGSGNFECRIEDNPPQNMPWTACTSPKTYTNLAEGTAGPFRFSVRASANDPDPAMYEWVIDTVAPTMLQPTPTTGYPSVNARLASSVVPFTPRANDDVRGYRCTLDGLPEKRCGGLSVGFTFFRNLSNGTHSLDVTATDFAGNTSTQGHRDFTVNSAPTYSDTPEMDWPELTDRLESSKVDAVIPDGSGGWFVGGNFTEIDGQAHTDLARIGPTGNVVAAFQPSTGGEVRTLKLSSDGNTLYVGGNFSSVNGDSGRSYLTAISTQTGALTAWDPNLDGAVNDIALNGTTSAYVVGDFSNVGSTSRKRVAEISLSSGSATGWGDGLNSAPVSSALSGRAVVFTTDHVYVGGEGTISQGTAETLVSRKSLAEITRAGTGAITSWNPSPDGHTNPNVQPSVEVLRVSQGSRLLVAGKFKTVVGGTTDRISAVEFNLDDKSLGSWRAQAEAGPAGTATVSALNVEEFSTPGNEDRVSILVGGALSSVKNWYTRLYVAETTKIGPEPANMGWPTDWKPEIRSGPVYDVATSGNMVAVAGDFAAEKFNARQDLMFFRDPAPETQWTASPPNISSRNPTFRFESTESHSSFECALDVQTYSPCTSPKTYSNLDLGQHQLRVRAVDSRGTPDPTPLQHDWTVQDYTSSPDTSWPWVKTGTDVRAVIPDGSGGWYVGGDFTEVCDSAHCYFREDLVHVKSDKTVDSTWDPSLQKAVGDIQATVGARALARSATTNRLYVGGTFTQIDGNDALRRIAAINLTTGEVDATWDPDMTNHVYSLALAEDGAIPSIYVGGTLLSVGNPPQARGRIAEVRLDNGQPTAWNPNILTPTSGALPQVISLALTATRVYAGGNNFGGVGLQTDTGNLVKINRSDGIADSDWRPKPAGIVNTLALQSSSATTIHAGGTFNAMGPAVGGVQPTRRRAAEVDIAGTGTVTDWDPDVTGGAVNDLDFVDPTVLIAGAFTFVSGEERLRLAQVRGTDQFGTAMGWSPALDSTAFALARQGSVLAVGGAFQHTVGSESHKYVAFYGPPPDE